MIGMKKMYYDNKNKTKRVSLIIWNMWTICIISEAIFLNHSMHVRVLCRGKGNRTIYFTLWCLQATFFVIRPWLMISSPTPIIDQNYAYYYFISLHIRFIMQTPETYWKCTSSVKRFLKLKIIQACMSQA
jgi:hypothetical protein